MMNNFFKLICQVIPFYEMAVDLFPFIHVFYEKINLKFLLVFHVNKNICIIKIYKNVQ